MKELLLGKLDWSALPHEWFTVGGSVAFLGLALFVVLLITRLQRLKWLWNEWQTSVDPTQLGIM